MTTRNPTYLSARNRAAAAGILSKHQRYFRLFSRCALFATNLLLQLKVKQSERQRIVSRLLLARLLESAQAASLLFRAGLERDGVVIVRVVFETFVYLAGCCADPEFVKEYLASDLVFRRKFAGGGQRLTTLEPEVKQWLQEKDGELEALVKKFVAKQLSFEQVAKRFGYGDQYELVYRLTSQHVHGMPRAWSDLAEWNAGRITGLAYGPSDKHTEVYLHWLAEYVTRAASNVAILCGEDVESRSRQLLNQLGRVHPEWPREQTAAANGIALAGRHAGES